MTAEQIADVLHARRIGDARWLAKCPAHPDRSPSLSIGTGRDGRVLLTCFAGCETADVLHTLGLRWTDICGSPMTPEQARKAAVECQERELRQQRLRAVERASFDRLRELHAITDELGSRLANDPDGPDADAVAQLLHEALNKIRQTEAKVTR